MACRGTALLLLLLFNSYLDDAVRHWQSQLKILHISDNLKKEKFIKTFMFADRVMQYKVAS
jgi:hypothetical protein